MGGSPAVPRPTADTRGGPCRSTQRSSTRFGKRIDIGTTVLDSEFKNLGTVEAYDSDTGYMRIEKDGLTIKDIFLPVTSVSYLDDSGEFTWPGRRHRDQKSILPASRKSHVRFFCVPTDLAGVAHSA